MSKALVPILEDDDEKKEIVQKSNNILYAAQSLVIQSDEQLHHAYDLLGIIKLVLKKIDDYFDPAITKSRAAWKENIAMKKKQSELPEQAKSIILQKEKVYHTEQENKRREEERRRQEVLQKQEEERKLSEAIETGDETILDEPVIVPEVKIEDTTKRKGISHYLNWKARVTNFSILSDEYKIEDQKKLDGVAKSMKQAMNIAGAEAYSEKVTRDSR